MTRRRMVITAILILICGVFVVYAQDDRDGQFCVRAYEDRNGNAQMDPGEPLLTRGIGANLLDSRGVVIQTALIDNSPTSAQGVICFLSLDAGQYEMEITSAEFAATTLTNMTVNITEDAQTRTTLFEFGAQRVSSPLEDIIAADDDETVDEATVERIAVSTGGAVAAMCGTAFVGFLLFLLLRRGIARRYANQMPPDAYYMRPDPRRTSSTGTHRVVPPQSDTGEFR